jgi:primosomal protein N' (replication factor Y)
MDPDVLEEGGDAAEPSDIYVTTWIGTKPALRPPATLVGVLDADRLIRRPDFRASENAYQALVEMAEWAGPAGTGGRLVVQTAEPGHHAVQAVVRADYRFFLERELPLREELAYPPFSELIKVTASGTGRAGLLERVAETARGAGARVLGPIPSGPPGDDDAAGELLLKCADAEEVAVALRGILASTPGGRLRVDVDPR